ncbi:hypothetical protein INR49_004943, partial [Caranx melampygus]
MMSSLDTSLTASQMTSIPSVASSRKFIRYLRRNATTPHHSGNNHSHIRVLKATMARSPWIKTPNLSVRAPLSQPCGFALLMSVMFVTSKGELSRNRFTRKTPLYPYMSMLTRLKKKNNNNTTAGDKRSTSSIQNQKQMFKRND